MGTGWLSNVIMEKVGLKEFQVYKCYAIHIFQNKIPQNAYQRHNMDGAYKRVGCLSEGDSPRV